MLLKVLLSEHYLDKMKLEEHMSTPVAGINANANLAQALSSMDKMRVNRLVVVETGRLYGIITRNDITEMADGEKQRKPQLKDRKAPMSNAPVRDFANKNVISIDLSEDMSKAAREMVERSISSLVVMRSEMPVGMITARDIIEAVVAKKRKEPERIFISGLDETSYQFEDSIREELNSMLLSLDKMHGIAGSYITLNLKRIKLKSYEMSARLQIEGRGIIMVHAQGESFHDAFSGIMHRLKEKALKEKDIMLSERKKDRHTGVDFGESE
jgi:CBS domain-containing protein